MSIHSTIAILSTQRIVTASIGGWRFGRQVFQIATYNARILNSGRVIWYSVCQSKRHSMPQLRRQGYGDTPQGSLHHKPVRRSDAVSHLGERAVSDLERRGVIFEGVKPEPIKPGSWQCEITDTFGGDANYSWVERYKVTATTELGAIHVLSRQHYGPGWVKEYEGRYRLRGAAVCCFVTYAEED